MLLRNIQPHAGQLLVQLPRGIAAVIGQKEVFLILVMKPLDKFPYTGKNLVAVVDHTVHIADEALFRIEIDRVKLFHFAYHLSLQGNYSTICGTFPRCFQSFAKILCYFYRLLTMKSKSADLF